MWNISRDRYARPFGRRRAPRATARLLRGVLHFPGYGRSLLATTIARLLASSRPI